MEWIVLMISFNSIKVVESTVKYIARYMVDQLEQSINYRTLTNIKF